LETFLDCLIAITSNITYNLISSMVKIDISGSEMMTSSSAVLCLATRSRSPLEEGGTLYSYLHIIHNKE